jgi:hypothetical protein
MTDCGGDHSSKKTLTCGYCGGEFEEWAYRVEKGDGKYCSHECRDKDRDGETVECDWCGDETYVPPSRLENNDHYFCDRDCSSEWRSERFTGEGGPRWNGGPETVSCEICSSDIEVVQSVAEKRDRFMCSVECQAEWQTRNRGEKSTARFVDVECAWCGKEYQRKPTAVRKGDKNLCSDECFSNWMSEQQRGSGNPAWKGGKAGITAVRRMIGNQSWDKTAREVRAGAGHVCEKCRTFQPNRKLDVHHIVPVASGGTNGYWNLMALCQTCHKEVENHTKRFTEPHLLKYVQDDTGK